MSLKKLTSKKIYYFLNQRSFHDTFLHISNIISAVPHNDAKIPVLRLVAMFRDGKQDWKSPACLPAGDELSDSTGGCYAAVSRTPWTNGAQRGEWTVGMRHRELMRWSSRGALGQNTGRGASRGAGTPAQCLLITKTSAGRRPGGKTSSDKSQRLWVTPECPV